MQQKRKLVGLNRYSLSALALVAILVITFGMIVLGRSHTDATPSIKPGVGAAVPSQFSFTGSIGWWQGATNETSMALFHNAHDCFVSAQHKTGTVNVATELQKTQASLTGSGYTVTPGSTQSIVMQTKTGPQSYELYQSTVTTPAGANAVEGGQEFGYLQLSDGYLFVEGYCDTAAELPATIPALQAIKFN
jgi:hypothetical protein